VQSNFMEGIVQTIAAACGPAGVLFVDDLHWADAATLGLLSYMARRNKGRPLFVLVTWRIEEVQTGHPLRGLLAEAERAGVAGRLVLSRLTSASIAELVGAPHAERACPCLSTRRRRWLASQRGCPSTSSNISK
jgi:predicted ATPase